ncbi:MAG TPA: Rieske (2Fe-2S) protein [Thermoplasmata archaeon]|nr:Rieske (2Fe-2S) protein [Thermoplasmata archaeon]
MTPAITFQKAVKEPDLGEDGIARAVIGKKEFAIVRKGGSFYGMDGICTHGGGPLGEGTLREGMLVCPWD